MRLIDGDASRALPVIQATARTSALGVNKVGA